MSSGLFKNELDEQIAAAERAVYERDRRVRDGVHELSRARRRAGAVARTRRKSGLALALGASALLLVKWLPARRAHHGGAVAGRSRMNPFGMLLSVVASQVMSTVSRSLASVATGMALPLVGRLMGSFGHARPGYPPLAVVRQWREAGGRVRSVSGSARVIADSGDAQLKISFAMPALRRFSWAWRDYWVLAVDDDYRTALVGTPDRKTLWLLARTPELSNADCARLLASAQGQGFDAGALVFRAGHS